jgi:hypothetical protein
VRFGPRAKLLAIAAIFFAPIAASFIAYQLRPAPSANYGELLLPPNLVTAQPFEQPGRAPFTFDSLRGKWVMVASDSGSCPRECLDKAYAMRQVRLALGRDAERVARVFVVDDLDAPVPQLASLLEGATLAITPRGLSARPPSVSDRAHIYLADPHGNVMMRWPANPDMKRMLKDLQRLLRASQIG